MDPSAPGKGATRLSLIEVENDNSNKNTNGYYDQEKRIGEGVLKREQEEMPGPGCCGCCELGTGKLVGGKVVAWMTGTMLPIAFRYLKEFMSQLRTSHLVPLR